MTVTEAALTKNRIISELAKSPHGKLEEYIPIVKQAVAEDQEFLAHLISWNNIKGQIRDSKIALPVLTFLHPALDPVFVDNSLAHLAMLPPRDLLRAYDFILKVRPHGKMKTIKRMIARYLGALERHPGFIHRALQHRQALKGLYSKVHVKPAPFVDDVIMKSYNRGANGTVFNTVANLRNMSPTEAAGHIMEKKIPFLVAQAALGVKAKEPELVLALINRMSPAELVTNTKRLEKLGIKTNPTLRSAFEEGLKRAATSKKAAILKTTVAADTLGEDSPIREKLQALQEKQIKAMGGVDGNWLILADMSGSMQHAIEVSRVIAATLAKMVKGDVHLVFFNTSPRYFNVAGDSYETILEKTRFIKADGGTSIGVGLQYILEKQDVVDGIAIVSDGAENTYPQFAAAYQAASDRWEKQVPVYFYMLKGSDDPRHTDVFLNNCNRVGATPHTFDLRVGQVDYYSLPNLVQTMRVNRWSLLDEVMAAPLLTLDEVLGVVSVTA